MTADTLRRAAALMRERAEATDPGPWIAAEQSYGEWYGIQSQWTALGTAYEKTGADYIASWHPAAALAVADLLEVVAQDVGTSSLAFKATERFARVYLGESQ